MTWHPPSSLVSLSSVLATKQHTGEAVLAYTINAYNKQKNSFWGDAGIVSTAPYFGDLSPVRSEIASNGLLQFGHTDFDTFNPVTLIFDLWPQNIAMDGSIGSG